LLRIFPGPNAEVPLKGLYLSERFGPPADRSRPFVYANNITSLDGRISLPDPRSARRRAPRAITNDRDWRLFQELAAAADAVVVSGRYVRDLERGPTTRSFPVSDRPEYADLLDWRRAQGLGPQPAVIVVSSSVDLPPLDALVESGRRVYVATGATADDRKVARAMAQGARVLRAGAGARVEGRRLLEALAPEPLRNIAVIGGGEILRAFLADDVLDRLYLTVACRILGGTAFDTLLTGPVLEPAAQLELAALHYDARAPEDGSAVEQLFAIFDRAGPRSAGPL
jgi:riboflavin biosynthesis pyrimidine reductase